MANESIRSVGPTMVIAEGIDTLVKCDTLAHRLCL